jgi:type II secretory pathway component PulF
VCRLGRHPARLRARAGRQWLQEKAKTKRAIAGKLAYPVFLIHAAILLGGLLAGVKGSGSFLGAFALHAFVPLGVLYAMGFGGYFLYKSAKAASPVATDTFVLGIPLIGGIARKNAAAISLRALAVLYGNGVPILRALDLAAETSPNAVVARVFVGARERVVDNEPLDVAFASSGNVLPQIALDMIATGNRTGQLDETLSKACEILDQEAQTGRTMLAMILGGAAFACAALFVAYTVISGYMGILNQAGL